MMVGLRAIAVLAFLLLAMGASPIARLADPPKQQGPLITLDVPPLPPDEVVLLPQLTPEVPEIRATLPPPLRWPRPLTVIFSAPNSGGAAGEVSGTLVVRSGGQVIEQIPAGGPVNLAPGAIAAFEATWANPPMIGLFELAPRIVSGGETTESSFQVLLVPLDLVAPAAAALLGLIVLLILVRLRGGTRGKLDDASVSAERLEDSLQDLPQLSPAPQLSLAEVLQDEAEPAEDAGVEPADLQVRADYLVSEAAVTSGQGDTEEAEAVEDAEPAAAAGELWAGAPEELGDAETPPGAVSPGPAAIWESGVEDESEPPADAGGESAPRYSLRSVLAALEEGTLPPRAIWESPTLEAPETEEPEPSPPAQPEAPRAKPFEAPVVHSSYAPPAWHAAPEPKRSPEIERLLGAGMLAVQKGEFSEAYRYFSAASDRDAGRADAWLLRAGTTSSTDEAETCVRKALLLDPGNPWAVEAKRLLDEAKGAR